MSNRRKAEKLAALDQVARRAEQARREVDEAIRIAHAAKASLRDIAKAAGVSHETVRRTIRSDQS